jgi:hypothetical protein
MVSSAARGFEVNGDVASGGETLRWAVALYNTRLRLGTAGENRPSDGLDTEGNMALLEDLVTSGRIVDLMLAFIVLEIVALMLIRRYTGGGIATWPLLTNIGAGTSLMLALRADLTGAGWTWIAFFLVAALVFHVSDLAQRWQRSPEAGR